MDHLIQYNKCTNDLCDRKVRAGVAFCCYACSAASEGGWEVHESGMLGHSDDCNERHEDRGAWTP